MAASEPYTGRFAPTPSGPLHFGSLVAAMASYLDARAAGGTWLVRIEDLDTPRNVPGADTDILLTLERYGMRSDQPVIWQSQRIDLYADALKRLAEDGLIYACSCSRKEIADSATGQKGASVYSGKCRERGFSSHAGAARLRVVAEEICFTDRAFGAQCQEVAKEVGDFVLQRADGVYTYQLAVVIDDGEQNVTDVVRGADLMGSTARQIALQRCLGLLTPRYLHVPVVVNQNGEKLSKQTGALAIPLDDPLPVLAAAALHLGLGEISARSVPLFWREASPRYAARDPSGHPALGVMQ